MNHQTSVVFKHSLLIILASMCVSVSAMPDAWITWRGWGNGTYANYIYLWNSGTHEIRQLYRSNGARPHDYIAFSPDGRKIALIIKSANDTGGIWTVNNDGTGAKRVCATFARTTLTYSSIQWTRRGLFWTENDRQIYWADPVTGQSKALGTLTANTNANILSMSRDGARAYLRTEHEISPGIGGIFFEIPTALNGLVNERIAPTWDHGSCMLADGRAAVWVSINCGLIGNPPDCGGHQYFAQVNFTDMAQTGIRPTDSYAWGMCGPGIGLHSTPNSNDHVLYKKEETAWTNQHYFIQNLVTGENREVTPTQIAPGGPITDPTIIHNECGEFWMGALPNPHDSTPSIAVNKTGLLFSNQTLPIHPDTVRITNQGGGTLSAVTLRAYPAVSWLTLTPGGSGNGQFVKAVVSAQGLANGSYTDTVTVKGGGAPDSARFIVTFSVGAAILAPANLQAVLNAGHTALTWTDNANNETGFAIERRVGTAAFSAVASVAANTAAYVDTGVVQGTTYQYRVRATNTTSNSAWSDTATISIPLPPIIVTAPATGASWALGSRQHIMWSAPAIQSVQIDVSTDEGITWEPVTTTGSISQNNPDWGDHVWTIPASLGVQTWVKIRIAQYQALSIAGYSGVFSTRTGTAVAPQATWHITVPAATRLIAYTIDGRRCGRLNAAGVGTTAGKKQVAGGVYLVRDEAGNRAVMAR